MPEMQINKRKDLEDIKRVELHLHTQMSQLDGVSSATSLIKRAKEWGMPAIAITDHGVVQAFPEANHVVEATGMKVIYGVEAYWVSDDQDSIEKLKNIEEYCVFDIETTGINFRQEKITEIGVMKIKNGEIVDTFECFVNPEKHIPEEITNITHITDEMVKDAETIKEVMPKFLDFVGNLPILAHNADFDMGFMRYNAEALGYELKNDYIDTLQVSRQIFPEFKKHKLGILADKLGIKVDVAHRALDDVKTLVEVTKKMIEKIKTEEIDMSQQYKSLRHYHAIILVKNYVGLKNLYRLVSISHLENFYRKPVILKSVYKKYSEGLILGSACEQGELYRAVLSGKSRRRY